MTSLIILLGLCFNFVIVGETAEMCSLMKPDARDQPGAMNERNAWSALNLFPNLTVPVSGRITTITVYAVTTGTTFASFWEDLGGGKFKLRSKVQLLLTVVDRVEAFEPSANVYVEQGDVLAIHYPNGNSWGRIVYENDDGEPTPDVAVYNVYTRNIKDNDLPIGHTLEFSDFVDFKRNVAIHIDICDCVNKTYGRDCTANCSRNCNNDEPCNSRSGVCDNGCQDGFHTTDFCSVSCSNNTYGDNCSGTCSGNCINGEICDPETGVCENGCASGYQEALCNQTCGFQRFGEFCGSTCHCVGSTMCDPVTGNCSRACAEGWEEFNCATKSEKVKSSKENQDEGSENGDSGIIAGIAIVFIVTILAVAVLLVLVWRRVKYRKEEKYKAKGDEVHINSRTGATDTITGTEENSLYANAPVTTSKPGQSRAIPVENLHDVLKKQPHSKLLDEYQDIPKTIPTKSYAFAKQEALRDKNKFKNIHPYEENRIVLDERSADPLSTYINASPVQDYDNKRKDVYIACQGPQKHTKDDFWRMVWQYKVYAIVMITNLIENMKIKCEQYWPSDGYMSLGGVQISVEKEETFGDIVVRHFKVTKNSETRWVRQFQYLDWPDHGVPKTTSTIRTLRTEVRKFQTKHPDNPVAVHCSAGVGRTGTFISIDYLLDLIEETQHVDVLKCVYHLRNAREHMVQTVEQYKFIYSTLDEHISLGGTVIQLTEADNVLRSVLDTNDGQTRMKQEYQFLEDTKPTFTEQELVGALSLDNKAKNRDLHVLPPESHRVQLESEDGRGGEYINALDVEGFKDKTGYVVTQVPMDNTTNEFWRLLMENNIHNVVYFKDTGTSDETWFPSAGKPLEFSTMSAVRGQTSQVGDIDIVCVDVLQPQEGDIYANVAEPTTEYANMDAGSEKMEVKFYIMPSIDVASGTQQLAHALMALQQTVAENVVSGQPLAVMCLNGAKDSGLYIACDVISKMFVKEPNVDVFNAVQRIRYRRPQFIASLAQYTFVYRFALEYACANKEIPGSTEKAQA